MTRIILHVLAATIHARHASAEDMLPTNALLVYQLAPYQTEVASARKVTTTRGINYAQPVIILA